MYIYILDFSLIMYDFQLCNNPVVDPLNNDSLHVVSHNISFAFLLSFLERTVPKIQRKIGATGLRNAAPWHPTGGGSKKW